MTLFSLKIIEGNSVDKIVCRGDTVENTVKKLNSVIEEKYSDEFSWCIFYMLIALSSSGLQMISSNPYTIFLGVMSCIAFTAFVVLLGGLR